MRAVFMWMKKRCKSAAGPISLSADGKSFISCYCHSCSIFSYFSCFLYIYKHNYGTIVLGNEGCQEVSGLGILFRTNVYIFSDSLHEPQNTRSDHSLKLLDLLPHMNIFTRYSRTLIRGQSHATLALSYMWLLRRSIF